MSAIARHTLAPTADNERPAAEAVNENLEEELRQCCYQYYLAQQALQSSEDDNIQLDNVIKTVRSQIEKRNRDVERLRDVKRELEIQVENTRYLPKGTDPEMAKKYIEAERILHTRIALADGVLEQLKVDICKTGGELDGGARTTSVLEESLAAQVRYNQVLTDTAKESIGKAKHEEQRLSNLRARRQILESSIQQERLKEKKMKSALGTAVEMKNRAQNDIRTRDSEAVRLRTDVAFGRRLHLGELEHAREQELWLEELLLENRKLKTLMANARKASVDLGKGNDGPNVDGLSPVKRDADASTTVISPSGKVRNVNVTTAGDNSLLNTNSADTAATATDGKKSSQPKRLVEEYRDYNLQLLQQMVNSMHILQTQMVPMQQAQTEAVVNEGGL